MATRPQHGMKGTPIYGVWKSMLSRCRNVRHRAYQDYGGRGITVCERWLSFENFFADMGKPPPGLSLDRINNDGIYEPSNCRWATSAEQQRNSRNARPITVNGETLCLADWARRLGTPTATIKSRLKIGWSLERACTEPLKFKRKPVTPTTPGAG